MVLQFIAAAQTASLTDTPRVLSQPGMAANVTNVANLANGAITTTPDASRESKRRLIVGGRDGTSKTTTRRLPRLLWSRNGEERVYDASRASAATERREGAGGTSSARGATGRPAVRGITFLDGLKLAYSGTYGF